MLPPVGPLFKLVRELGLSGAATEITAASWLIRRHGLGPLVANHRADLRPELAKSVVTWSRFHRELPEIIDALQRAGIRVAGLKGLSYGTSIYESPAQRPMSDADLLVPQAERDAATRALEDLGFTRDGGLPLHHATPFTRGGLVIDLHHDFIGPGRGRIAFAEIWSRTTRNADGLERLDPADELAFHFVHMARNRLRGPLLHVVDAGRLMKRAAAETSLERARCWGLGRLVGISHQFCASILSGEERDRPAGWIGPSRDEIAFFREWGPLRKIAFDAATAGSTRQLLARFAGYANRFSPS